MSFFFFLISKKDVYIISYLMQRAQSSPIKYKKKKLITNRKRTNEQG